MRELSLFSGAGGGLLGTKLLGFRSVGYVERDAYCQAVLQARIRDGLLDPAPIFGDIREFLRSGDCDRFAGRVDVVTAGFPCQPFSVAGKRAADADERNLWPETAECLRRVRPRIALLENVPGLASHPYFGTVLGDLAALGFDAEWTVLGADDAGAPHRRKRLWILAYSDRAELWDEPGRSGWEDGSGEAELGDDGEAGSVANADGGRLEVGGLEEYGVEPSALRRQPDGCGAGRRRDGENVVDTDSPRQSDAFGGEKNGELARDGSIGAPSSRNDWWYCDPADEGPESESFVGRVAHGVANRVDRLRALGNGQVPAVVVLAWRELTMRLRAAK